MTYFLLDALVLERLLVVPLDWFGASRIGAVADLGVYLPPPHQCGTVHHHEANL